MMTSRERVFATFTGDTVDKVPVHHIGSAGEVASVVLGREAYVGGGIQQWREAQALWNGEDAHKEFLERSAKDAFDLAVALGHDILRLQYWRLPEKPTLKKDEYTYLYGDPDGQWQVRQYYPETELFPVVAQSHEQNGPATFDDLEQLLESTERDLDDYHPTEEDFPDVRRALEKYGREYAIRVAGGRFSISYVHPIWLEAAVLRPDLVSRSLDCQLKRAIQDLKVLTAMGAKLFFGGGDFASNQGPFYSPKVFRELMLPRLKAFSQVCHELGGLYLFASDGNLWPVADDLFGASGIDGFYEIDRRAGMDLHKLRSRFPDLTLVGNIASQTLHLGTKDDVIAETRSCIDQAKAAGRIIVGTSNFFVPGTPPENVMAMIETIEKYR